MHTRVLGLDIGGANLKAAHSDGTARLVPFELWKHSKNLPDALKNLLHSWPVYDHIAATMTGELCDCFATRREGVVAILDAAAAAAGPLPVWTWLLDGRFIPLREAIRSPLLAASANWLALATFAGRIAPSGPALLIDVGSTTTDIVPLFDGKPVPHGRSDKERLKCHELLYTGVRRTPVCAVVQMGLAAELFATTLDAYILLKDIAENRSDCFTADGRPASSEFARARLARMLGADWDSCSEEETIALALEVKSHQIRLLRDAIQSVSGRLPGRPRVAILAGSGEFLLRQVLDEGFSLRLEKISLAERIGPALSPVACAYAVAVLAAEEFSHPVSTCLLGSINEPPDASQPRDR
jgi:probable H4MPT-linked C1 transfer pathway protein